MTYFHNPAGLVQAQGTSFAETLASGSPAIAQSIGGSVGTIAPRQLEKSNVDQFSESLSAQELSRAISANLSMVKLASDMISSFIQKLG